MRLRKCDEFETLLDEIPWFEHVGEMADKSVTAAKNWHDAETYVCGQVWVNFKNAISNRWRRKWLDLQPAKKQEAALASVEKLVKGVIKRKKLNRIDKNLSKKYTSPFQSFEFHLRWDLNFAGFEFICQDEFAPLFFLPDLLSLYQRGHFPCGWHGTMIKQDWSGDSSADFPKGRLRVL